MKSGHVLPLCIAVATVIGLSIVGWLNLESIEDFLLGHGNIRTSHHEEFGPREWAQVAISLIILSASLFVILTKRYTPTDRHWAYGALGTVIGFWLKG
jgi:hypothetical protein